MKINENSNQLNDTQDDSFLNYSLTSAKKNSSKLSITQNTISTNETFDSNNSRFIRDIADQVNAENNDYEKEQIYKIKVDVFFYFKTILVIKYTLSLCNN